MAGIQNNAEAVAWLRSPQAIRARCGEVFATVEAGDSPHFMYVDSEMAAAARFVCATIRENHPDLKVPPHSRWRHFSAGGTDRWSRFESCLGGMESDERARLRIDLAVTSVLLDAGAGGAWRYREPDGQREFSRSEGLAVASFHLFTSGAFSADPVDRYRADADAMKNFTEANLAAAFQVGAGNPLSGMSGRAGLLRRLGAALEASPELFGRKRARIGNLFDYLAGRAVGGVLPAREILDALLTGLAPIWPGRIELGGVNLGDVWRHPAIKTGGPTDGLVPFHKLSQWLAYSLVEPLEEAGLNVVDLDELTGLAEYRNGGLFVDLGVLRPRSPELLTDPQKVSSNAVVEWRASTVVLLDRIAGLVRDEFGVDAAALPLCNILEGGTWSAGRKIAARLRPDGGPPIQVISDGTVM